MSHIGPVASVLALLAIVVLAVAFGIGGAPVFAVAVVAIGISQRRLVGRVASRGERAPLRRAVTQAWWAPMAGLLGLMLVVGGVGTIFEAHNWGGRILGSALLMAFGFCMLYGLVRRPFAREAGNVLILIGTIPPLLFFWVIVPPILAIIVWIGVISGGFSEPSVAPAL